MIIPLGPKRPLVVKLGSSAPVATSNRLTRLSPASPIYSTSARAVGARLMAASAAAATKVRTLQRDFIAILLLVLGLRYYDAGRIRIARTANDPGRPWVAEGSACRRDLSGRLVTAPLQFFSSPFSH